MTLDQIRGWYQEHDVLELPGEVIIGPDRTAAEIVQLIMDHVGFCPPPVLDRVSAIDVAETGQSSPHTEK